MSGAVFLNWVKNTLACVRQIGLIQATLWGLIEWMWRKGQITWRLSARELKILCLVGCLQGVCLQEAYLAIFAGLLLFACVMDWKEKMVVHFVWWLAVGVVLLHEGIKLLWQYYPIDTIAALQLFSETLWNWGSVLSFFLLQELFFCHFYGRADAHAFGVCGLLLGTFGWGLTACFTHMVLAFLLLIVVQLGKKNIGPGGRLKEAVAFLPYITVALWLMVFIGTG